MNIHIKDKQCINTMNQIVDVTGWGYREIITAAICLSELYLRLEYDAAQANATPASELLRHLFNIEAIGLLEFRITGMAEVKLQNTYSTEIFSDATIALFLGFMIMTGLADWVNSRPDGGGGLGSFGTILEPPVIAVSSCQIAA